MLPLAVCSVVGLAWAIHLLARMRVEGFSKTALLTVSTRDLGAVERQARAEDSALGRVIAATIQGLRDAPARADDVAQRAALAELDRWEGPAEVFAFLARVAPLLGLLGTVVGMVELFSDLEAADESLSAAALSGGIWKALLTTAAGMAIAIPALAFHAWLVRRLDRLRVVLEQGVGRVLDRALGGGR